jgi:ppGpp synthetase/RelA/SpoT-type nucleotidyltranferase
MTNKTPVGWKKESVRHREAHYKGKRKRLNQNISNKTFLFSDFDGDGVPNMDDKYPLDPSKSLPPEVFLSDELKKLEKHTKKYNKTLKKVEQELKTEGYTTKSRIKSVNSIINKFRRKHIDRLQDIAGLTILTQNREESRKAGKYIEQYYNVTHHDDYYTNPNGKYEALHYIILIDGKMIEIQIKTQQESELHQKMHTDYKTKN